jgi:uncharacterized membrane protein YhiD involved in acid resistance
VPVTGSRGRRERGDEPQRRSSVQQIDITMVIDYMARFFLAVLLGVVVSFRRKMTRYDLSVVQAHAFLSTAGAMFMLIIGGELFRAVGLLGAASVVRYRYAIRNPRDAGTLIIALGLGMACGSGLLTLAVLGGSFVFVMAYVLDHFPQMLVFPRIQQREQVVLKILTREYDETMQQINEVFERYDITYALRTMAQKTSEQKMGMSEIEMHVEYPVEVSLTQLTFELSTDNLVRISWEAPRTTYY